MNPTKTELLTSEDVDFKNPSSADPLECNSTADESSALSMS